MFVSYTSMTLILLYWKLFTLLTCKLYILVYISKIETSCIILHWEIKTFILIYIISISYYNSILSIYRQLIIDIELNTIA
jgi:hypothetical protein